MERLEQIIIDLQEAVEKTNLKISDEALFDGALRILNTQAINSKNELKKTNFLNYPKESYKQELATEKQKDLIKKLNKGIVPAGITKQEAIKFIQELNAKT